MLRFIGILVLFYLIIRFLRGLFQTNVIVKNYHYHQNSEPNKKQEGDVKIISGKDQGPHKSDDMGEYVDYEEVK